MYAPRVVPRRQRSGRDGRVGTQDRYGHDRTATVRRDAGYPPASRGDSMNSGWLGVIKTDGVPILIVTVLLALYSFLVFTGAPSNQHLETMTAMVAAFYFGGKTVAASAESVRSTAAAISG